MSLTSFIPVSATHHFPIQNLPYGVFSPLAVAMQHCTRRVGVAIGDFVLDLAAVQAAGLFTGTVVAETAVFAQPTLNAFMALGQPAWAATRARLQSLLHADNPTLRDNPALYDQLLWPATAVQLHLPAQIGDYTDFYSSREHAGNVGRMFGRELLIENWLHLPVGYHGRSSSVVLSGTPIRRPRGQVLPPNASAPLFLPSMALDFELEMGFFIGPGNPLGQPIPLSQAADHIFGLVLVNDWSARDIQQWEYRPLGPFLSKNFATSISPWVVPLAALEPFRVAGPVQEPTPLPYLQSQSDWAFDIHLEVHLQTARMAEGDGGETAVISRSNARHLYWNMAQQLAHHTITGCNLQPGDLLASGTISGPTPESYGCMLELAWRGTQPIPLPTGESRVFLQDGDQLTLTGWGQGEGYRVGFGDVTGVITAA